MIAARVIGRMFGRYDGEEADPGELDCKACLADPDLRRFLGCGAPPEILVADERGQLTVQVTPEWWRDHCADTGQDDGELKTFWAFASWGQSEIVGPWFTCPRYYDEFAEPLISHLADEALQLAWWLERGSIEAVARLPLSRTTERAVRLAVTLMAEQEALRFKRPEKDGEDGGEH